MEYKTEHSKEHGAGAGPKANQMDSSTVPLTTLITNSPVSKIWAMSLHEFIKYCEHNLISFFLTLGKAPILIKITVSVAVKYTI